MKMTKHLTFLGALITSTLTAQTNINWSTNWVKAENHFRIVDGQLYNVELSSKFIEFRGEVTSVTKHGSVIAEEAKRHHVSRTDSLVSNGNFLGSGSRSPGYTTWETTGKFIFIRNYPSSPAVGQKLEGKAMKVANYDWNGEPIEGYDYGQPNYSMVITTNGRKAFVISTNTMSTTRGSPQSARGFPGVSK